ncbi:MAG: lamin tail domain-containing protein [Deltaproteobacteria bacterium]|nr:MAG: lamin tail domain-containing protein [Deltaproteobacteria bacterium]
MTNDGGWIEMSAGNFLRLLVGIAFLSIGFLVTMGPVCGPATEVCDNDRDDDGDGLTDCADDDCQGGDLLVVSEIQYHPTQVPDTAGEYVELRNDDERCIDLGGWTIQEGSGLPATHFEEGTRLAPGETFVIAGNARSLQNGGVPADMEFHFETTLNDDCDRIEVEDSEGNVRIALPFCNGPQDRRCGCQGEWPPCPEGAAVEFCGASTENTRGDDWQCATTPYGAGDLGTPNADNVCAPR